MKRILALIVLLPAAAGAGRASDPAGDKRFLWKASSGSSHVYLLGSIHLAKKELYPLAPEIEKAFAASKILVVEADQAKVDPAALQRMVVERGLYPAGDSLSSKLPEARRKQALELAAKVGLPAAQAERMKPWFLALNATLMKMGALGYDPQYGIDRHFMEAARAKGLPIQELESTAFQLDLLSGFSDDLQGLFVASTLEDMDGVDKKMAQMFDLWKAGDAPGLEKVVLTEGMAKRPEMAPLRLKLFDERNAAMAEKVLGYLKTPDVHFVVMGAGHLLGEQGVVEILRRKGVSVAQVESP